MVAIQAGWLAMQTGAASASLACTGSRPCAEEQSTAITAGRVPILSVRNLSTEFETSAGSVRVVDQVCFDLFADDVLAVVGESGSGKSMMALSVMNLVPAPGRISGGDIVLGGRSLRALDARAWEDIRGRKLGMVFQNPRAALHPAYTVRRQLVETLRRHEPGLGHAAAGEKVAVILRRLGFNDPARVGCSYPHALSGGMCQRIALALCLAGRPQVILADEPTTALDVLVQATLLMRLKDIHQADRVPIVLITHDFGVVRALATRIAVMYAGQLQEEGDVEQVLSDPRHPYTRALIACVPHRRDRTEKLYQIGGQPPDLSWLPTGCRFAPRCQSAMPVCRQREPELREVAPGCRVRCHLHDAGGIAV